MGTLAVDLDNRVHAVLSPIHGNRVGVRFLRPCANTREEARALVERDSLRKIRSDRERIVATIREETNGQEGCVAIDDLRIKTGTHIGEGLRSCT